MGFIIYTDLMEMPLASKGGGELYKALGDPGVGVLEWNNREIADGKVMLLLIELSSDRAQKSPHFVNLHIL